MNRAGANKPADDQTKLKKLLDELTKREENKFCADCGCRGPRWASINLGVFICIACSGIHRSLGVHLTFVRSVNLDSWTSDQVAQMQKWGNARAKEYYEANVPRDYRIPTEHSSVRDKEQWIREKYERKRFVARDDDPRFAKQRRGDSDDDDSEDDSHRRSRGDRRATAAATASARTNSGSRAGSGSRTGSSSRRAEAAPPARQQPVTQDILTFDAFASPPATPQAAAAAPPPPPVPTQPHQQAANQDEWATFAGSSASSSSSASAGFADAFATPAPADQHVNKMANIMASFGPSAQPMQQLNAFGGPPPQAMGMHMGMMGGGGLPMNPMNPMNPMMMQQTPNGMMMNPMMQPPPNGMFGAPMMGGGGAMFPGAAPPMGFHGAPQPMGMGMPGGMMNPMGGFPQQQQPQFQQFQQPQFQQQQQQQQPQFQQQQQQGGLNQPFVNLGGSSGGSGKNPFF